MTKYFNYSFSLSVIGLQYCIHVPHIFLSVSCRKLSLTLCHLLSRWTIYALHVSIHSFPPQSRLSTRYMLTLGWVAEVVTVSKAWGVQASVSRQENWGWGQRRFQQALMRLSERHVSHPAWTSVFPLGVSAKCSLSRGLFLLPPKCNCHAL